MLNRILLFDENNGEEVVTNVLLYLLAEYPAEFAMLVWQDVWAVLDSLQQEPGHEFVDVFIDLHSNSYEISSEIPHDAHS